MKKCLSLQGATWRGLAAFAALGLAASSARAQTWIPAPGANEVLGTTGLSWFTTEHSPWVQDAEEAFDATPSMRGGANESTGLKTTVTGPGVLQFRWQIALDENLDGVFPGLAFFVGGEIRKHYINDFFAPEMKWKRASIAIPAGGHEIMWQGVRDGWAGAGGFVWLDAVSFSTAADTPANAADAFWLWGKGFAGGNWWSGHLNAANAGFTENTQNNPADYASRIYRAATTLAKLAENENLAGMFAEFGGTWDVDNLAHTFAFNAAGAPASNEAVDRAAAEILPAIESALADLNAVPANWTGAVNVPKSESGFDENITLDIGDVLAAKSALHAAKAAILIAQAYDLGVDYAKAEATEQSPARPSFNTLLNDHPDFMKDVRDEAKLPVAKESLRAALETALAAHTAIVGRADNDWHFIEYDPAFADDWNLAKQKITETLASLNAPQNIHLQFSKTRKWFEWNDNRDYVNEEDLEIIATYRDPLCFCYNELEKDELGWFYWDVEKIHVPEEEVVFFSRIWVVDEEWPRDRRLYRDDNGWYLDNSYLSVEKEKVEVINQTERIHLGAFFTAPYLTRAMLPSFTTDNEVMTGTFADTTFGGILPNWNTDILMANLASMRAPVMQAFTGRGLPAETQAPNGNASITATAAGTPTLQWQVSADNGKTWSNVPGATSATLALTGLSGDDTGKLYRIVATYANGVAYSAPTALRVASVAGPLQIAGAYDGYLYDSSGTVRGILTVAAKPAVKAGVTTWTLTAKAVMQTATVSFTGKVPNTDGPVTLDAKSGEKMTLNTNADTFDGTVSGGKITGTLNAAGARNAFADKKDGVAQGRLDTLRGLYNVALLDDEEHFQGYATLNVGNLGAVKIAGSLADGTKFSGGAKLLEGLNDNGWLGVALHRPLYSKKGSVGGVLWIKPDGMREVVVDKEAGRFADWIREGVFNRRLDALGGRFTDGKAVPAVPRELVFGASLPEDLPAPVTGLVEGWWVDGAFPWELPVQYNVLKLSLPKATPPKKISVKGETPYYDYEIINPATGLSNPSGATLSYTAKTGLFKGSFKMYYDGFNAKNALQHKTVSVPYTGVMVPREGGMAGFGSGTATVNKQKIGIPVRIGE